MKIFSLLVIVLLTTPNYGQVSIAPTMGLTYSSRTGWYNGNEASPEQNNKFILGFTGGVAVNIELSKMISLQTEFLWIQKGMITASMYPFFIDFGQNFKGGDLKIIYNFLEIPLLIKFSFGNDIKYFVETGPYVSYAINGKYKYEPYSYFDGTESSGKINFEEFTFENIQDGRPHDPKYFNQLDVGIYIGGGIGKKVGPGTLLIDLRYGFGFIDYYKIENFRYVPEGYRPFYNRNFNLTFAYFISLGKK